MSSDLTDLLDLFQNLSGIVDALGSIFDGFSFFS